MKCDGQVREQANPSLKLAALRNTLAGSKHGGPEFLGSQSIASRLPSNVVSGFKFLEFDPTELTLRLWRSKNEQRNTICSPTVESSVQIASESLSL